MKEGPSADLLRTTAELLAASRKLTEEMRALAEKADELADRHRAILKEIARRKQEEADK